MKLWRKATAKPEQPAVAADLRLRGAESRTQLVERLFREHNESLIRFLQARVGSYHEAREVAQEAYVRLLSLDQPDAVSYLRAFLFKTAANIAIDRRRRDKTYGGVTELPLFREFADHLTPERQVEGEQTLSRLERLITAMPAKCQQSFVLNQIYGMDTSAVAAELGLSESMVRKYVARALVHCRAQLGLQESKND